MQQQFMSIFISHKKYSVSDYQLSVKIYNTTFIFRQIIILVDVSMLWAWNFCSIGRKKLNYYECFSSKWKQGVHFFFNFHVSELHECIIERHHTESTCTYTYWYLYFISCNRKHIIVFLCMWRLVRAQSQVN
jgi:hypothetical protein